jgi:hypothetical protein
MFIAQVSGATANGYAPIKSPASNGVQNFGGIMPSAGNITNLYIYSGDPTPGSYTVTMRKNGVATLLTATIASGTLSATDSTHTVAVVGGDVIDYVITTAGGAPDGSINCSVEVDI